MLNSAEHEIINAHKYKNIKKFSIFSGSDKPRMLFFLLINVKMLAVWGLMALWDSHSTLVYIGPSPRMTEKEKRNDRLEKTNVQTAPPAPTAVGPFRTIIHISKTPRHWKFTHHHRTTRPPQFWTARFESI